jgi:hypothetical protein
MYTCIWIHIKCHFYTIHPWCYFHQLRMNPTWGTTEPNSCCPWAAPRCSEACQGGWKLADPIIISISKGGIRDNVLIFSNFPIFSRRPTVLSLLGWLYDIMYTIVYLSYVRLRYFEKSDHCHCQIQAWHLQSHPNFQILNCRVKSETSNMLGMEKPAKKRCLLSYGDALSCSDGHMDWRFPKIVVAL